MFEPVILAIKNYTSIIQNELKIFLRFYFSPFPFYLFPFTFSLLSFTFFLPIVSKSQISIGESPQIELDYIQPKEYEIGGIKISGTEFLDQSALISISGLKVGDKIKIPGDVLTKAIKNLWKQGILGNIDIQLEKTSPEGNLIFLEFVLTERPRLSKFTFTGIRKGKADDLREKIKLIKGRIVTETMLSNTKTIVKQFFVEKGFLNTSVTLQQIPDSTLVNSIILKIKIDKKKKVKIQNINFENNQMFADNKLRRKMKETKVKRWYKIFSTSKFIQKNYDGDKAKVINFYNSNGYRDAVITSDTVYPVNNKRLQIDIKVHEGNKYYFRNINWSGNYIHSNEELNKILGIKKGDVYNVELLDKRLHYNPNGSDISSLYLDDGYLFFSVNPVEVMIENDSIDMEMRIYEGQQATINNVSIAGNTRTSDHVIRRELRTIPGEKFSRADIIRSQRELAQLGFFDPEKIQINPVPDPQKGTVDIEYSVEEKPSDQIEFSGGWGGGLGFVGTVGLTFGNFSLRKAGKLREWSPLPSGDGQRLSLRTQLNGLRYQNYSFSFTEPWFGGRKPNSFTLSMYHSIQRDMYTDSDGSLVTRGYVKISGVSVGLGKRITWPDDYFTLNRTLSYQLYSLKDYYTGFLFSNGTAHNISIAHTIARNSLDVPAYLFPRKGSSFSFSVVLTPPYSLFDKRDFSTLTPQEKYKWVEYHKWRFDASWFNKIAGKLVLNTRFYFGYLGKYNNNRDIAPFERFYLGGSGLAGFSLDGREIIALRGYEDNSILPAPSPGLIPTGGTIFDKFTVELRFPLSLNPMATIFLLSFAEAGNNWSSFSELNPFDVYRSVGGGVRLFLPMFGLLGFDMGYGFDKVYGIRPGLQPHFIIGFQP